MADEPPAFPKPRARGAAYRDPARIAPSTPPARRRTVVTRPEPGDPEDPPIPGAKPRPSPEAVRELLAPIEAERTFWQRHRFFYRYPRLSAAFMLVGSAFAAGPSLSSHGHSARGLLLGSFALSGLWVLVTGAPLESDGRPPGWWQAGFFACIAIGVAFGAVLSLVL